MTKNDENFQKWMMNQFGMTEKERRNHTFEGKIDTISEMAGIVMEIMFLANMGTMAKNDFNNMMNSSGGMALQNKVNGVKAGAANAFNGVGRKELALPGGGTIEWVEGKAVPIQFATGGNGGGVVPPIPPGGTNSGGKKEEDEQGREEANNVTDNEIPTWKGSGPSPGILGINGNSKSSKSIESYNPKNGGIEFVFDARTNTFVVGKPKGTVSYGSPHQRLATTINADGSSTTLGGTFSRGANGEIFTTENSGHYGINWTPKLRKQFIDTMNGYGIKVNHESWSGN